jgi:uncharacterized protein
MLRRYGVTKKMDAIFKGEIKIVIKLMAAKCGINETNNAGQTPFMYAALFGREDIAKKLIEQGANTKIKDAMGFDALKLAEGQGNEKIIKKSEK